MGHGAWGAGQGVAAFGSAHSQLCCSEQKNLQGAGGRGFRCFATRLKVEAYPWRLIVASKYEYGFYRFHNLELE